MRRQAETVAWTIAALRRSHALRASLVALSVGGPQSTQELTAPKSSTH